MNLRKITFEHVLFALAVVTAAFVRLLHLGGLPLSDAEALPALQALDLTRNSSAFIGPQAGYVLLTALGFFLTGATDFAARAWPALSGSLLVLAPILLRERLGRKPALVLAFGLALDPGLVALSRQAGGPMLALSAAVLAGAFWLTRRPIWAGVFAGLALLGGPPFWLGALGLGVAYALYRWQAQPAPADEADAEGTPPAPAPAHLWRAALVAAAAVLVFGGTLTFRAPQGLSAAASGLTGFVKGWGVASGVPVLLLPIALVVYQPLALIGGVWRGIVGRDAPDRFLRIWALVALLLALAYPSRQVGDLLWVVVPLWALAARQMATFFELPDEDRTTALVFAGAAWITLVYAWVNLTGLAKLPADQIAEDGRLIAVIGALALLVLASLLIAWGWSRGTTRFGVGWGLGLALALFTLGGTWGAAGLRERPVVELWQPAPAVDAARLLPNVLGQFSEWTTGRSDAVDVVVAGISAPSLKWALRGYDKAEFTDQLAPGLAAAVVITAPEVQPALATAYRGEDFVWVAAPDWMRLFNGGWLPWLVTRQIDQQATHVILWSRADLYPGAAAAGQPAANPVP